MTRRIYTLSLLLLMLSFGLSAQNTNNILDKAAKKFQSYAATEITFEFSMVNEAENIKDTQTGKAWMKNNMYKLNLMGAENYYDGKVVYTYMPEMQEVNIKNPSAEEEELLNPTTLFNIHQKGFSQKLIQTQNNIATIELTPTNKNNKLKNIKIWVNKTSSSIQKVIAYGLDGNNIEVLIKEIKNLNPVPADSFFKFDTAANPSVMVIDMR